MATLDEWKERARRGTSGDMVDDMLMDWEAENRTLHSQVRELEQAVASESGLGAVWLATKESNDELKAKLHAAQARITALEAENADRETSLQCYETRIAQLEGALNRILSEFRGVPDMNGTSTWHVTKDGSERIRQHAQHALTPNKEE